MVWSLMGTRSGQSAAQCRHAVAAEVAECGRAAGDRQQERLGVAADGWTAAVGPVDVVRLESQSAQQALGNESPDGSGGQEGQRRVQALLGDVARQPQWPADVQAV